jgi:hypothetical protein
MAIGDRCGMCYPYVAGSMWVKWAKEKEPQHMAMISMRQCSNPATQEEVADTITIAGVTSDLISCCCLEHSLVNRAIEREKVKKIVEEKKKAVVIDDCFGSNDG